jgi:hypothetical protein
MIYRLPAGSAGQWRHDRLKATLWPAGSATVLSGGPSTRHATDVGMPETIQGVVVHHADRLH